jgi:shikimate dehydrogenase
LGAEWTYAAARGLPATGPGQLDLDELLERYRFRSIDASTQIYGIVGRPVQGSLSPVMHNDFFGRLGLNAIYIPFEEEDLSTFVGAAKELGVAGLSVTRPFKEAILSFIDAIDDDAKAIGAVNTVSIRDGKWLGSNTDAEGVVRPIARRTKLEGKRVVILGAGGAARAAAVGLRKAGANVVVLARNPGRARAVADVADGDAGSLAELARRPWDVLINATPLSSGLLERGREPESLRPGAAVLDMVYDPEQTELLELARQRGATAIPGLEMLVAQAVRQAEIWTDSPASEEYMELAAREELRRRANKPERVSSEDRISRKSAP